MASNTGASPSPMRTRRSSSVQLTASSSRQLSASLAASTRAAMGNGYLADETRYLDPVAGEKGRKALPSVRIGDHVLVRLTNTKHDDLVDREERKLAEESRVRRLHQIDQVRVSTYKYVMQAPDLFFDELERSNATGAIPAAFVWLSPPCAAALRFAARLAGQVAEGPDAYARRVLLELPKVEKFLGRRKKVGPGAALKIQSAWRRAIVRRHIRRRVVRKYEKRTNEFGKDV